MKTFLKRLSSDVPMMLASALDFHASSAPSEAEIKAAESPFHKSIKEYVKPAIEARDDIAIVPVQGALAYNPDAWEMLWDGIEDSRNIVSMLTQCYGNPNVKGVLLRMDTPGGMLLGGPEIADAVDACRKNGKPVVTHVGGLGCSLGYMIAARSNEIVANRSAIVGSIGVISSITDYSAMLEKMGIKFEYFTNDEAKYKGAGALGAKLTDDQRTQIQASVNSAFKLFKDAVTERRPSVRPSAMQGQTFRGSEAKSVGLIDRVGTENFALSVLREKITKNTN